MEQNYQYNQGNAYNNQQQYGYQQQYSQQQYGYQYPVQVPAYRQSSPSAESVVASYAEQAFSKGLAAAIMCQFPIASFVAIGFGHKAVKLADQAKTMAQTYGISAGGKANAAKILGMVGKIAGIVYSVSWGIGILYYVIYFVAYLFILLAMGGY